MSIEFYPTDKVDNRKREIQLLINIVEPDPEYQPSFISDEATFLDITAMDSLEIESKLNDKNKKSDFVNKVIMNQMETDYSDFKVFVPLEKHHKIKLHIVDSLINTGVKYVVSYSTSPFDGSSEDTTYKPESDKNYILWRDNNKDSIKFKIQNKLN